MSEWNGVASLATCAAVASSGAPGTEDRQNEARQIIHLLLEHGADPKILNKQGKRPVDYRTDDAITTWLTRRNTSV